jgi:hypothetical protein
MALTDQQLLSEIQSLLAEPIDGGATWPCGQWPATEVVKYLNDAQQEFVAETGVVLTRPAAYACVAGQELQDIPEGTIAIQRLVWVRTSDSRRFVLSPGDLWQMSHGLPTWRSGGVPKLYSLADTPQLKVRLAPIPNVAGTLELTSLAIPTPFTGAGVAVSIPDEVAEGIVWQTIANQLTQEGRAKDPGRAAVAAEFSDLILDAVKLLLQGWEA